LVDVGALEILILELEAFKVRCRDLFLDRVVPESVAVLFIEL
jgi:hypothetical protein